MKKQSIDFDNMYVKMIIAGLLGLTEKEGLSKKEIEDTLKQVSNMLIKQ